jgi:hypothetical protein
MGWVFSERFNPDRRTELDKQLTCEGEHKKFRVLKSAMVGPTYYAAVEIISDNTRKVTAVVVLTEVDHDEIGCCGYKILDENMGPDEAQCPADILDLLTPTDNGYALDWRRRCRRSPR